MTASTARDVTRVADTIGAARAGLRGGALARFLATGAANTALSFLLFRGLLFLYDGRVAAPAGLAQATTYAVAIPILFAVSRRWTFRSRGAVSREAPRFLAAHFGLLLVSSTLLEAGVSLLGVPVTACWVLVTGLTTVSNFVLQRFWVFRSD